LYQNALKNKIQYLTSLLYQTGDLGQEKIALDESWGGDMMNVY